MIPLKLYLKNFLSYGPSGQTIDFEHYNLICLNGKNGHGKSALLDAMTWAIWGQARKISGVVKPDAQLLRLGQTHMSVVFDFIFNGQPYRIKREYTEMHGKSQSSLDFALFDTQQKMKALTDKTIKATQEKIESILGLDFESFINSAFLRQGQANEFSKKSPKERKDVLASILNLDKYEHLKKLALEKVKKAAEKATFINQGIINALQEIEASQYVYHQIAKIKLELENLVKKQGLLHLKLEELQAKKTQLQSVLQKLEIVQFKIEQLNAQKYVQEKELLQIFSKWRLVQRQKHAKTFNQLLEEKNEIIKKIAFFQETLQTIFFLKEQLIQKKENLNAFLANHTEQVASKQQYYQISAEKIVLEQKSLENIYEELEKNSLLLVEEMKNTQQKILQTNQEKLELEKQVKEKISFVSRFEKRKLLYHTWVNLLNSIQQEGVLLEQKKMLAQDNNNPSCQLCEQNLSASRKRFLQAKFGKLESWYIHRKKRLNKLLPLVKESLLNDRKRIEQYESQEKALHILHIQREELLSKKETSLKLFAELNTQMETIKKKHHEIKQKLQTELQLLANIKIESEKELINNSMYQTLENNIKTLEKELNDIAYEQQEHEACKHILAIIERKCEDYRVYQEEISSQNQRKSEIKKLCAQLKSFKKELQILKITEQHLFEQKRTFDTFLDQEKPLAIELNKLLEYKEMLMHQRGSLEHQEKIIKSKENFIDEQRKQIKELEKTSHDYALVATALGKEGIQALLIEDALPEIEHEANELLAQLSNNQAHIIIESLRDLKKGGTRETLDIKISDPMGVRPYELFSGGEAFRIDFALRIAISKLLARRAGTSLQTLIIDEGFGSQDDEGLMHIMDAINKIQSSFAKIIIVSHLPIIKEQFPVHFLVQKGPQGSCITVVEH